MCIQSTARRYLRPFAVLAVLAFVCAPAPAADAATIVRFTLDQRVNGAAAPFVLAASQGLYRAENLEVTTTISNTDGAIARLAKGDSDIALIDLNALIRYRESANAVPLKAVFILHNENGYSIIARRSRGVDSVADLQGKTLGVAEGDLAIRMWPAVAKRIGIDVNKVKLEKFGAAVSEPMLSAGQVDAVSGLSYASALNLRDRGVPLSDLVVIRFADFGDRSYGRALVVNPAFAAANPEAVAGFIRAVVKGVHLAIKRPARAADDVLTQMDGGSRELEFERIRAVLHDNIVTPEVKRDGIGGITRERFDASIDQIAVEHKFRSRPNMPDIFDDAFLPPAGSRKIN